MGLPIYQFFLLLIFSNTFLKCIGNKNRNPTKLITRNVVLRIPKYKQGLTKLIYYLNNGYFYNVLVECHLDFKEG